MIGSPSRVESPHRIMTESQSSSSTFVVLLKLAPPSAPWSKTWVMAMAVVIIASAELVATVPLGVRASIAMPVHVQSTSNVTVVTGANNVQGQVKWPTVKLLGVVDSFTLCEQLCYSAHRPQHRSGPQQEHDQEH